MLELVEGFTGMRSEFGESDPDEKSASDVVTLDTRFAALTVFKASELFAFAVQLLDLPAKATHLSCGLGGILSWIVSHDKFHTLGRHYDSDFTAPALCAGPKYRTQYLCSRLLAF